MKEDEKERANRKERGKKLKEGKSLHIHTHIHTPTLSHQVSASWGSVWAQNNLMAITSCPSSSPPIILGTFPNWKPAHHSSSVNLAKGDTEKV